MGPLLALKQPGKQTALHFSLFVVKTTQTRQPVLHTPAEEAEAAHQAPRGLLAGDKKIYRNNCVCTVLVLSLVVKLPTIVFVYDPRLHV